MQKRILCERLIRRIFSQVTRPDSHALRIKYKN